MQPKGTKSVARSQTELLVYVQIYLLFTTITVVLVDQYGWSLQIAGLAYLPILVLGSASLQGWGRCSHLGSDSREIAWK